MEKNLKIGRKREGSADVLVLDGQLDTYTAPDLDRAIEELVSKGSQWIILECSGLNYVSSAGFSVFIESHAELAEKGRKFALAGMPERIRRFFDMLGFSQIVSVYNTLEEALST